jgi:hypothetical protein
VAGVGSCGFCGVIVSGGGAGAVSPAAHREHAEEGFAEEGKEEGGEGVPLQGATVNVDGGGGAVWGDTIGGRDTLKFFAIVDKCGGAHIVGACD